MACAGVAYTCLGETAYGFQRMRYAVTVVHPSELTAAETRACVKLIVDGGAVGRTFVKQRFPDCVYVAVTRLGGKIVGVGVIKSGDHPHTATVARQSGVELSPGADELGYIAVQEEHQGQGISRDTIRALLSEHDGPLFATTWSARMRRTLVRVGFMQRGKKWRATGAGDWLSLWVRD